MASERRHIPVGKQHIGVGNVCIWCDQPMPCREILLDEHQRLLQRSRDEDTARIRLNHARIEAEERAAKAEAERDDLVARLAAAEAALVAYADLIDYKPFMEFERAFNSIIDNESAPSEPDERERWLIRQAWVAAMNVAHDALAGSREQAAGEGANPTSDSGESSRLSE